MVRCFLAVEVSSPQVRGSLTEVQAQLRRACGSSDPVKWVLPHQMHITLKFLGEIQESSLKRVIRGMEGAAADVCRFQASAAGLGGFPSIQSASVLWAGIQQGRQELISLARAVDRELYREGFARERRPFSPHLTLGRVRRGRRLPKEALAQVQALQEHVFGQWPVTAVLLIRSQLTPRGPVYTTHHSAPLCEENSAPGATPS